VPKRSRKGWGFFLLLSSRAPQRQARSGAPDDFAGDLLFLFRSAGFQPASGPWFCGWPHTPLLRVCLYRHPEVAAATEESAFDF